MMKKIDVHLHVTLERREKEGNHYYSSGAEMLEHMQQLGIEKGIVMSAGEQVSGWMCSNREAQAIHEAYPEQYGFMCNVDEIPPEQVYDLLAKYKKAGAVGIGELVLNRRINDPLVEAVFAAGEKLSLPITFHMSPEVGYSYGIVDEPGLPLLEKALQKYPRGIFLGHSPTFWIEISKGAPTGREERNQWGSGPVLPGGRIPELFEKYPNLYGDLSANSAGQALMRDEAFGLAFLERFSKRLLFGTDMVNTQMTFPLGPWLDQMEAEGKLSTKAYRRIIRENAERIYHL